MMQTSRSHIASGRARNALSLERNLAHIAGCSSVPTSDVATEFST
jgi:hypothetical protein